MDDNPTENPTTSNAPEKPQASTTAPTVTRSAPFTNSLKINKARQEGNPVIKYVRNVPFEYAEIKADFECGRGCGLLYLSLKWHKLHQNYIETRFSDGAGYAIKILLVLVNVEDPTALLRDMNMFCYRGGWTLILCYSVEEAAEYIENLKISERKKPEEVLQGREQWKQKQIAGPSRPQNMDRQKQKLAFEAAVKFLSSIRSVTQSDAKRLLGSFGTLKNIAQANKDDLSVTPGLGPIKAQNVYSFFRTQMKT
uniref:DisA/LigA helix-hairpin-helix motif domain-containing protein n=1 Tax=Panagrolaimus sp. ES5 TaxID=591445 RepID=A0AC34FGE4_9BILA